MDCNRAILSSAAFVPTCINNGAASLSSKLPHKRTNTRSICMVGGGGSSGFGRRRQTREEREAEIAAKIAELRRLKRLKSSKSDGNRSDEEGESLSTNAENGFAQRDVPAADTDGCATEAFFAQEIADAEAFLGTAQAQNEADSTSSYAPSDYRPRVSTWGVFPRPENISRAYGGGRTLPTRGTEGSDEQCEEARRYDASVREKLRAYKESVGISNAEEDEHLEEIKEAVEIYNCAMNKGRAHEALEALRKVQGFVSNRSSTGGKVLLALALACEGTGRRSEAKKIYSTLTRNSCADVARKARTLLAGFAAMDKLKLAPLEADVVDEEDGVNSDVKSDGAQATSFALPDFARYDAKRYETAAMRSGGISATRGGRAAWTGGAWAAPLLLAVGPALVTLLLAASRVTR